MDPELLGAGNGQQAPITIKVAFLGSMLGPSALLNMGYRPGLLPIPIHPPNSLRCKGCIVLTIGERSLLTICDGAMANYTCIISYNIL